MTTTIISLRQIRKVYEGPGMASIDVLRGIDMDVDSDDSLAIVGPSGSGKSTLLNIMGTLDRPSTGTVLVDGADTATLSDGQLAGLRRDRIGFVFQKHHLLPQCTVLENVLVPAAAARQDGDGVRQRAQALLERVGLADRLEHRPGQLSGGECQRVAFVRALVNRPGLLLADEPTGSLDHAGADALTHVLLELRRDEGVALVVVTHSRELAARMTRQLELKDGWLR